MERPDQGSPLPSDPAGREDIMSDEQAGRDDVSPAGPGEGTVRPGGEGSPLPSGPARREDVIREDVIRDDTASNCRTATTTRTPRRSRSRKARTAWPNWVGSTLG